LFKLRKLKLGKFAKFWIFKKCFVFSDALFEQLQLIFIRIYVLHRFVGERGLRRLTQ